MVNKSNLQVAKRWKTKDAKWELFSAQLEQSKVVENQQA
jgi:hypothetical protein